RANSSRYATDVTRVRPTVRQGGRGSGGRTRFALVSVGGVMKELVGRVARHVACACGLAAVTASAQEVVRSPEMPSKEAVTRVWTAAAKAAAHPMPLREAVGAPVPAPASLLKTGIPGSVDGNPPAEGRRRVRRAVPIPDELRDVSPPPEFGTGSTVWYDYPPPSSLFVPVLDYVYPIYPHTSV